MRFLCERSIPVVYRVVASQAGWLTESPSERGILQKTPRPPAGRGVQREFPSEASRAVMVTSQAAWLMDSPLELVICFLVARYAEWHIQGYLADKKQPPTLGPP